MVGARENPTPEGSFKVAGTDESAAYVRYQAMHQTILGLAGKASLAGFGALSVAGNYGPHSYKALSVALRHTGREAHHLIPQRFAPVMGQKVRDMLSIAVTRTEHQVFTNAWRDAIPYGAGTANATQQQVLDAARQIYANYPAILKALGL
jgi:hypothetical protein